jgi:hypothetical protein
MRCCGIVTPDELRQVDHRGVIAWERFMRETDDAAGSTVRRRLAALSSLFNHLVEHSQADRNPVAAVRRPAINRDEGFTLAFSRSQARKPLDTPSGDDVAGDLDHDGDIDLADLGTLGDCMTGPRIWGTRALTPSGCELLDFDRDWDVDVADFARIQIELSAP